jgi:hypothetical protein
MFKPIRKFTTSGLKGPAAGSIQRQFATRSQKITRATYPWVNEYEKNYLFGNPAFSALSPKEQEVIRRAIQEFFFDWMSSIRSIKLTNRAQKEKKYAEIANNILSDEQRAACLLLMGEAQRPVFNPLWDVVLPVGLSMPMVDYSVPIVTGVIKCSQPLSYEPSVFSMFPHLHQENSVVAGSAGCESDDESTMQEPVLDERKFFEEMLPFPDDESAMQEPVLDERKFFNEMLPNPDVADTLREIWRTQAQISSVFKQSSLNSLDALLRPEDWFSKMYPGSP